MSAVNNESGFESPRMFFFHEDRDLTFELGLCEVGQEIRLRNIRGSGVIVRDRKPTIMEHIRHWLKGKGALRYRVTGVDPDPYQVHVKGFKLDVTLPHHGSMYLIWTGSEWLTI